MPLSRKTLERQLSIAKQLLRTWSDELAKNGVDKLQFRRDPKWRHLNADCNQINRRLAAVAKIEAVNEEVAQRKAEKLAAVESA